MKMKSKLREFLYSKIDLKKPPLPWQEHIEKTRLTRSPFSFENFIEQQHKTRLQIFHRRQGTFVVDKCEKDLIKKNRKQWIKEMKNDSRARSETVESWNFSTTMKEIRDEEQKLFDLQRAELELFEILA